MRNMSMCRIGWRGVLGAAALVWAAPVEAAFVSQWQLGSDNGSQGEFSQENAATNAAPGSATVMDDDWYFAGTYPAPIGTVAANEPLTNFERALTTGDTTNRIHFNLPTDRIEPGHEYRLIVDTVSNNTSVPTSPIPFSVLFNGVEVFSGNVTATSQQFVTPIFTGADVSPTTGDNVVTLTRANTGAGWMQFDFVRLDVQVPEPSSVGLAVMAGAAALVSRRRR
ncbi:MAG TPA: PEP-CTERM sorting domain-containing protein [Tepidisphaeraceae bacterium]|nr:PEP-CTERM sorting domain-containing protein [Tepidisphaeraceae bacterium]